MAKTTDTAAQTAQTTIENGAATADQFAAAGTQAFRETVDRSLTALNDLNALQKRNLEAMVASVTAATKGAEALGAQAVSYSKRSMEDGVQAAKSLSSARSVQEVVELQTTFARQSLEAYMGELNRMSETVAASVKDSMKPLNERVTAVMEQVQSAR